MSAGKRDRRRNRGKREEEAGQGRERERREGGGQLKERKETQNQPPGGTRVASLCLAPEGRQSVCCPPPRLTF